MKKKTDLTFELVTKKDVTQDPKSYEYLHNYIEIVSDDISIILTYALNDENFKYENLKKLFGEKKLKKILAENYISGDFSDGYKTIMINIIYEDRSAAFIIPVEKFNVIEKQSSYTQKFDDNFITYNFNGDKITSFSLHLSAAKYIDINADFEIIENGFSVGTNGFSASSKGGRNFGGIIIAPYCKVKYSIKVEDDSYDGEGHGYHDKTIGPIVEAAKAWYWTKSVPNQNSSEVISFAMVKNQKEFANLGNGFQYFFNSSANSPKVTDAFDVRVICRKNGVPEKLMVHVMEMYYFIVNGDIIDNKHGYVRMKSKISRIENTSAQSIFAKKNISLDDIKHLESFAQGNTYTNEATSEFLKMPTLGVFKKILKDIIKRKIIEEDIFRAVSRSMKIITGYTLANSVFEKNKPK